MPSCPKVITTQCPIPATMIDYWQMVYEQGTEVIVMLAHENETGKVGSKLRLHVLSTSPIFVQLKMGSVQSNDAVDT